MSARGALVVLCAASFLAVADTTIVSIALPTIRRELGFSPGGVQWVLNAYTLVFAGMLLLCGRLGDTFGRRRVFTAGLLIFAAGTALSGIASSGSMLIAGRFVQGLGAAAFVPSSLSLLTTSFPDDRERSRALARYGAMAGLGFVVGMVGGGVITQLWGWRGIFWINVPIVVWMLAATPRVLPASRADSQVHRLDLGGAVTITAGLLGIVYSLTSAPRYGWASPTVWGAGLVACMLLAAFLIIECHHQSPLAPPTVLARAQVLVPNGAMVLQSMVGIAWLYLLTLYFQDIRGADVLRSGALFAPMTAASIAGACVAGRAVWRFGLHRTAAAGVGFVAAGITVMTACLPLAHGVPPIVVGMVIGEFGFMLSSVALTVAATTALEDAQAGLAAGLLNASTQIGGGIGLAIVATVVAAGTSAQTLSTRALQYGFLACLIFSGLTSVLIGSHRRTINETKTRSPSRP